MPDNLARALAALPATVPRPEQCGETVQYLVCDARRFAPSGLSAELGAGG